MQERLGTAEGGDPVQELPKGPLSEGEPRRRLDRRRRATMVICRSNSWVLLFCDEFCSCNIDFSA